MAETGLGNCSKKRKTVSSQSKGEIILACFLARLATYSFQVVLTSD